MIPNVSLSPEEERKLATAWREHQDAKALHRLVEAHMRLVIKIAREHAQVSITLSDLIQEGNLGLLIAARKFDPAHGTRLVTYASYWIRAYILDFIVKNHGPVRFGTTRPARALFFNLGRALRALAETGREPSAANIAAHLDLPLEDVERVLPRLQSRDISLNGHWDKGDNSEGDPVENRLVIPDDRPPIEETLQTLRDGNRARRLVRGAKQANLDPREADILKRRYLKENSTTLSALGRRHGVSRERIRQLEVRALGKVRAAME